MLVAILAVLGASMLHDESFAEKNTFFDSVKFIQYLDENTALEEVKNGNLDIYYYTIPPDRLKSKQDREGLQVFDSTGGTYSILVNPAETEKFNPFSNKDIRFALNYLVDRKLIVNELMGGYGSPIISYYGPSEPEYLTVIEQLETYNFRYNPALANEIISKALEEKGAVKINDRWQINEKPVEIIIFIRSDDPVRKSIGEVLSVELERMGFAVKKEFGDLNKAFVIIYGSDPSDVKWNLYTEGWGRSAFVKYDSVGLGQMYSPWYSYMPGFNDPSYWNYENDKLDSLTQKIYTGDFETSQQRTELIQQAVIEGIDESVRIFLASKIDQYVVNEKISGVVNDFGAGIPSRFTPINAKSNNDELVIGVKQIYQGAWNPIMGFTDSYSRHIWEIVSDPATFKHPFTGETFPVRATWKVETDGPNNKIDVHEDAKIWNPTLQRWENGTSSQATSKVTFDFKFSNWHNGQRMDMNDLLHSLYFAIEWGTQTDENDKTFDTEFTPRVSQSIQTIKGVHQIDEDTVEVYVDYWHFDQGEIAEWAVLWNTMPWEITEAMGRAVIDGKVSFSRSGATSKNVNWLSLIIPNDANTVRDYLKEFKEAKYIPESLKEDNTDSEYYQKRYQSSIDWIENKQHAVISNGPFYLESYSPESRTIKVSAFDDDSYPFKRGEWSKFENTKFPSIEKIDIKKSIQRGKESVIVVETKNSDSILYFLADNQGKNIISDTQNVEDGKAIITISSEDSENLGIGANNIKIFAMSESVLKPDFYQTDYIVTEDKTDLPVAGNKGVESSENQADYRLWIIPIVAIIGIGIYLKKRSQSRP